LAALCSFTSSRTNSSSGCSCKPTTDQQIIHQMVVYPQQQALQQQRRTGSLAFRTPNKVERCTSHASHA
jgi:hypothetical protein